MKDKFEVGDKVRAFGVDGIVEQVDALGFVRVGFVNDVIEWFPADGKASGWHKEPSLILVEKKKPEPVIKRFYERVGRKTWLDDDGLIHNGSTALGVDSFTSRWIKTGRYFDWNMTDNKLVGKVEVE